MKRVNFIKPKKKLKTNILYIYIYIYILIAGNSTYCIGLICQDDGHSLFLAAKQCIDAYPDPVNPFHAQQSCFVSLNQESNTFSHLRYARKIIQPHLARDT